MKYIEQRFIENLNIAQFETEGKYNFPKMHPCKYIQTEFIGFNYAKSIEAKKGKGIHFFIDDYQFERLWKAPTKYIKLLEDFDCVMTPDFSLYTDFPKALQIYNHYRKQWLGAFWQSLGFNVIPTVSWSDESSFKWCFDGIPHGATIAISSVGTQRNEQSKILFKQGWHAMIKITHPETVIFYGNIPDYCKANIIRIKSFQEKFREVKIDGWQR